jgi:hypothetical protein
MSRYVVLLLMTLAMPGANAFAQKTTVTVSGFPLTVTPTAVDFANDPSVSGYSGFATTSAFTYSVAITTAPGTSRTMTVSVACGTPCPASGSKALSSLQWRRNDLSTWNTLTTTAAAIETRTGKTAWSNSVFFRFLLNWTTDTTLAATSYNITVTLTVTIP